MVAKGANPYKPIVVDDSGTMATPISLVGADLIGLITTVPSYSVKVISISYTYTTRKNPLTQGPEVGSEVGMSRLPGNKLGGAFGKNGTATLLDRSYSKVGHVYQVTESYVVEVIPPLSEVKKRGGQV